MRTLSSMGLISFIARKQRVQQRRTAAVLAIVVALSGGAAIALAAGALRTADVVDRYYAPITPYSLSLTAPLSRDEVRGLPGVVRADRLAYVGALSRRSDGTMAVVNLYAMDGPPYDPMIRIRDGASQPPADTSAMQANRAALDVLGVHVGDTVTLRLFLTAEDYLALQAGKPQASGGTVDVKVTAEIDTPDDYVAGKVTGTSQAANLTEAVVPFTFYDQHVAAGDMADFGFNYMVQLADPGAQAAFEASVLAAAGPDAAAGVQFSPPPWVPQRASLETPARVQAIVLAVLAVLTAIAGLMVLALIMRAAERRHRNDDSVLSSLGMTRHQRSLLTPRRWSAAVVGGSVSAVVVAVLASGRFPLGAARPLERSPGIRITPIVPLGGLAFGVLALGVAFVVGAVATRRAPAAPARPPTAFRQWWSRHAPLDVAVGSNLALPRPSTVGAGLSRQAVIAGGLSVALFLAVAQYTVGVSRTHDERPAHGFNWDAVVGNVNFQLSDEGQQMLRDDSRFGHLVPARYGSATFGGVSTEVLAYDSDDPADAPTIIEGRAPRTATEVALGARLLRRLHLSVGDVVSFSLRGSELLGEDLPDQPTPTPAAAPVELTVVGTTLLPTQMGGADLGDAAAVTMATLVAGGASPRPQMMLARFAAGADRSATIESLDRDYPLWITADVVPVEVENLWGGRILPIAGVVVMSLLAAVLLAYTVSAIARLCRRDLAIMRALGMTARGTSRAVLWQGVTTGGLVLVVGVPLGALGGAVVWRAVASHFGLSAHLQFSVWWLGLVPVVIALTAAAATVPSFATRRMRVAEALRVE